MALADVNININITANTSGAQAAIQALNSLKNQAGSTTQQISNQGQAMSRDIQGAFRQLSSGLTSSGIALGMATAPIIAGFMGAVNAGVDFERTMTNVSTVVDASAKDFDRLKQAAKDMSRTTVYSATDIARAMYDVGSAGYDTNQIIAAMPAILDLAAATQSDLASASKYSTEAMKIFRMEASEMPHIANTYAATIAYSSATLEKMGESMKIVGPIAQALGWSVEDVSSALAVLYDSGMDGSMAATSLRTSITNLVDPTKGAKDALKALGITAEEVNPATHSLSQIVAELTEHHLDAASAAKIFDNRAMAAMLNLTRYGAPALEAYEAKITGTNKATEMATKQMDTAWGSIQRFKNELQLISFDVFEKAKPLMKDFFGFFQKNEGTIKSFVGSFVDGMIPAFKGLLGVADGVMKFFNALPKPIQELAGFATVGAAIAAPIALIGGAVSGGISNMLLFSRILKDLCLVGNGCTLGGISTAIGGIGTNAGRTAAILNGGGTAAIAGAGQAVAMAGGGVAESAAAGAAASVAPKVAKTFMQKAELMIAKMGLGDDAAAVLAGYGASSYGATLGGIGSRVAGFAGGAGAIVGVPAAILAANYLMTTKPVATAMYQPSQSGHNYDYNVDPDTIGGQAIENMLDSMTSWFNNTFAQKAQDWGQRPQTGETRNYDPKATGTETGKKELYQPMNALDMVSEMMKDPLKRGRQSEVLAAFLTGQPTEEDKSNPLYKILMNNTGSGNAGLYEFLNNTVMEATDFFANVKDRDTLRGGVNDFYDKVDLQVSQGQITPEAGRQVKQYMAGLTGMGSTNLGLNETDFKAVVGITRALEGSPEKGQKHVDASFVNGAAGEGYTFEEYMKTKGYTISEGKVYGYKGDYYNPFNYDESDWRIQKLRNEYETQYQTGYERERAKSSANGEVAQTFEEWLNEQNLADKSKYTIAGSRNIFDFAGKRYEDGSTGYSNPYVSAMYRVYSAEQANKQKTADQGDRAIEISEDQLDVLEKLGLKIDKDKDANLQVRDYLDTMMDNKWSYTVNEKGELTSGLHAEDYEAYITAIESQQTFMKDWSDEEKKYWNEQLGMSSSANESFVKSLQKVYGDVVTTTSAKIGNMLGYQLTGGGSAFSFGNGSGGKLSSDHTVFIDENGNVYLTEEGYKKKTGSVGTAAGGQIVINGQAVTNAATFEAATGKSSTSLTGGKTDAEIRASAAKAAGVSGKSTYYSDWSAGLDENGMPFTSRMKYDFDKVSGKLTISVEKKAGAGTTTVYPTVIEGTYDFSNGTPEWFSQLYGKNKILVGGKSVSLVDTIAKDIAATNKVTAGVPAAQQKAIADQANKVVGTNTGPYMGYAIDSTGKGFVTTRADIVNGDIVIKQNGREIKRYALEGTDLDGLISAYNITPADAKKLKSDAATKIPSISSSKYGSKYSPYFTAGTPNPITGEGYAMGSFTKDFGVSIKESAAAKGLYASKESAVAQVSKFYQQYKGKDWLGGWQIQKVSDEMIYSTKNDLIDRFGKETSIAITSPTVKTDIRKGAVTIGEETIGGGLIEGAGETLTNEMPDVTYKSLSFGTDSIKDAGKKVGKTWGDAFGTSAKTIANSALSGVGVSGANTGATIISAHALGGQVAGQQIENGMLTGVGAQSQANGAFLNGLVTVDSGFLSNLNAVLGSGVAGFYYALSGIKQPATSFMYSGSAGYGVSAGSYSGGMWGMDTAIAPYTSQMASTSSYYSGLKSSANFSSITGLSSGSGIFSSVVDKAGFGGSGSSAYSSSFKAPARGGFNAEAAGAASQSYFNSQYADMLATYGYLPSADASGNQFTSVDESLAYLSQKTGVNIGSFNDYKNTDFSPASTDPEGKYAPWQDATGKVVRPPSLQDFSYMNSAKGSDPYARYGSYATEIAKMGISACGNQVLSLPYSLQEFIMTNFFPQGIASVNSTCGNQLSYLTPSWLTYMGANTSWNPYAATGLNGQSLVAQKFQSGNYGTPIYSTTPSVTYQSLANKFSAPLGGGYSGGSGSGLTYKFTVVANINAPSGAFTQTVSNPTITPSTSNSSLVQQKFGSSSWNKF